VSGRSRRGFAPEQYLDEVDERYHHIVETALDDDFEDSKGGQQRVHRFRDRERTDRANKRPRRPQRGSYDEG
jgi:hypothetical protein